MIHTGEKGFTAVEVLVTILIAVVLLGGGYQAYTAVLKNSETGRTHSIASNIAYEALRQEEAGISGNCTAVADHSLPWSPSYNDNLPEPYSLHSSVSCPYGTSSSISLLTVYVKYGSDAERVTHAIYTK